MKNKRFIAILRCIRWIDVCIAVAVIVGGTTRSFVIRAEGWTRSRPLATVPESDVVFEPFVLNVWSGDGIRVYGLCVYYNAKSVPVTIDGIDASNGYFYPDVVNQVSNAKDGDWRTLERPANNAGKPAALVVEARGASKTLRVDLNVFIPLIGKVKYGRLLLKNGEAAVFQINDLQPPEKRTDSSVDAVKTKP